MDPPPPNDHIPQLAQQLTDVIIGLLRATTGVSEAERLALTYEWVMLPRFSFSIVISQREKNSRKLARALERNRLVVACSGDIALPLIALPAVQSEHPPPGIIEIFPTTVNELMGLSRQPLFSLPSLFGT